MSNKFVTRKTPVTVNINDQMNRKCSIGSFSSSFVLRKSINWSTGVRLLINKFLALQVSFLPCCMQWLVLPISVVCLQDLHLWLCNLYSLLGIHRLIQENFACLFFVDRLWIVFDVSYSYFWWTRTRVWHWNYTLRPLTSYV